MTSKTNPDTAGTCCYVLGSGGRYCAGSCCAMGCNGSSRGSGGGPRFGGASFGKGRVGLIRRYFLDYCFASRITATFLTGMAMLVASATAGRCVASATAGLRLPARGFYKRLLSKLQFGESEIKLLVAISLGCSVPPLPTDSGKTPHLIA